MAILRTRGVYDIDKPSRYLEQSNDLWDWVQYAPKADVRLYKRAQHFSDLFWDMLFDEDEINGTTAKDERGKLVNFQPEELHYFCYDWVRFCVRPLENCSGKFEDRLINKDSIARNEDEESRDPELEKYARITIDPKYVSDDSVLLHEMIHLHETALEDFPTSYHDTLLWQLYQKLFEKIPDLNERVTAFTCLPIQETITTYGGCHDILFLLKSYDLDIRMGYPLGKVLGYRVPGFPVKE